MVQNDSTTTEGIPSEQLWNAAASSDLPTVPDQYTTSQYTFVDGAAETVTFAWPANADSALATAMIATPDKVPRQWQVNFFGPPCKCHTCEMEGLAEVMTRAEFQSDS